MYSPITQALYFLIDTLFSIAILLVLLRFLLQMVRADFYNPLSQFVVKVTNPVIVPLRRLIPGYAGIDVASLLLIYVLCIFELVVASLLFHDPIHSLFGLLILGTGKFLSHIINFYFYTIFMIVILSWIAPAGHNPVVYVLRQLTAPLLAPAQRLIPPIGGFDLSPVIVIMGLKLIDILVIGSLNQFAAHLQWL